MAADQADKTFFPFDSRVSWRVWKQREGRIMRKQNKIAGLQSLLLLKALSMQPALAVRNDVEFRAPVAGDVDGEFATILTTKKKYALGGA